MVNKVNAQSTLPENAELDMLVLREIEALEKHSGRQERSSPLQMVKEETGPDVPSAEEAAREDGGDVMQEISDTSVENTCEALGNDSGAEEFIAGAVQWLQGREDGETILDRIREALFCSSQEKNNE